MTIYEEIYNNLEFLDRNHIHKLQNLNDDAFVVSLSYQIGVAIPYYGKDDIYELFNSIEYKTFELENIEERYLGVFVKYGTQSSSFALICEDFVNDDKYYRTRINQYPLEWSENWKELLGNRSYDDNPYDLLGELISYYYVYQDDATARWCPNEFPTHDIETSNKNYEVKSSKVKSNTIVHINSMFQLQEGNNPTYLLFLRFEKSRDGYSINDIINLFDMNKRDEIVNALSLMGYNKNSQTFKKTYKLLEMKKYLVDENFPILHLEKLNDNNFKERLISADYAVSLDSLECEIIAKDFLNK